MALLRIVNSKSLTSTETPSNMRVADLEALVDNKKLVAINVEDMPSKFVKNGQSLPPDYYAIIQELAKKGVFVDGEPVLDITQALAEVDLVYKSIYRTITNANFPETIAIKDMVASDFMYSRHLDGEPVYMNTFKGKKGDSVSLEVNAGGWQTSFKDKLFRKDYKDQIMRANAARGYRHFLNYIHLKPIVDFAGVQNKTKFTVASIKATAKADMTWFEKNWYIIKAALGAYAKMLKDNKWTGVKPVVLMNSVTESWFHDVADAVDSSGNKRYPALTAFLANRVIYDGANLVDGDKKISYETLADGVMMIVAPKGDRFIELEKVPLTLVADEGLAANLGQDTTVLYDCRGAITNTDSIIRVEVVPLSGSGDDSPISA